MNWEWDMMKGKDTSKYTQILFVSSYSSELQFEVFEVRRTEIVSLWICDEISREYTTPNKTVHRELLSFEQLT